MDDAKTRMAVSFGGAYKALEALVQADFTETAWRAMIVAFGASPEFRLVEVLARATEPLQLSEIGARSGATRRALAPQGLLRGSLRRMERAEAVINVGSIRRPLYQLNPLKEEAKFLASLFENHESSTILNGSGSYSS